MVISEQEAALLLEQVLDRVTLGREDVMIERPHGEPVVLLSLEDYLALTAALVGADSARPLAPEEHEGAEVFSLDARRRLREERAARRLYEHLTAP